jgi:glutamate synthase (NADPH/NADH) small chain
MTTPGLSVGRKGNIEADDETGRTSLDGIWAGGDVVTGAATVISAMGAGRKAAKSIHEALAGQTTPESRSEP